MFYKAREHHQCVKELLWDKVKGNRRWRGTSSRGKDKRMPEWETLKSEFLHSFHIIGKCVESKVQNNIRKSNFNNKEQQNSIVCK